MKNKLFSCSVLVLILNTIHCMDNYSPHAQLFNGIKKQNIATVEKALKRGANVNKFTKKMTPLLHAVIVGNAAIVQLLIEHGADLEKCHKYSVSPIMAAIGHNHTDITKLLINAGADVHKVNPATHITPLQALSDNQLPNIGIINSLFKCGASYKQEDSDLGFLLRNAAYKNNTTIVWTWMLAGADIRNAIEEKSYRLKNGILEIIPAHTQSNQFLKKAFITKQVLTKRAVAQATIDNVLNSVDPNKKDNDPTAVFICQLIQSCPDFKKLLMDQYALSVNSAAYTVTPCAIISENPLCFDVIIKKK